MDEHNIYQTIRRFLQQILIVLFLILLQLNLEAESFSFIGSKELFKINQTTNTYTNFNKALYNPKILPATDPQCSVNITSFVPSSGPPGTLVTITGTGFTGTSSVSFNGISSSAFTVISDTEIKATIPFNATSGPIFIENGCIRFSNSSFDVLRKHGSNGANDLFISAMVEGSSNNKAIVIANYTGNPVNLGQYSIWISYNGGTSTTTLNLNNVTLHNNQVWVVVLNSASDLLKAYAHQINSSATWFNGNDAIVLRKNGVDIDIFGK